MDPIALNLEVEASTIDEDIIVSENLDEDISQSSSEEEQEDSSLDSDVDDDLDELSSDEENINIKTNIISLHETYSNYYSNEKITSPILTKFEKAKILGIRAEMLSNGAMPVISKPYPNNTYLIAVEELKQKKIPLLIRRKLPNGNIEDWRLEDLILCD